MSSNLYNPIRLALRSTAIRQALFLSGIFAFFTTVIWLATYFVVVRDTQQLVKDRLETLIDSAELSVSTHSELPTPLPGQNLAMFKSGKLELGAVPENLSIIRRQSGFHHTESTTGSGQTDYVLLVRDINDVRLVATENVERLEETTDIFLKGLQFALLTSLLATLVSGLWIARRHQARLDKINHALEKVSMGKLDSRINLAGAKDDDLGLLADRIDATTARLETTMTQMRVQTANIAHDLRTPLARLRAMLEDEQTALYENKRRVNESVLDDALTQIDQIVDTFNAILRIARIESGAQRSSFIPVPLNQLVNTAIETFGPVIEDQGQSLITKSTAPANVRADPDMIIQLLGNLIQNALRYGAKDQKISIEVMGSQLMVSDQGPGIPEGEREQVLQPLYQRESQRQSEGSGLGLALVKAICDLHEATLTLNDNDNGLGLCVLVTFPTVS